jgi:hypothetical protein
MFLFLCRITSTHGIGIALNLGNAAAALSSKIEELARMVVATFDPARATLAFPTHQVQYELQRMRGQFVVSKTGKDVYSVKVTPECVKDLITSTLSQGSTFSRTKNQNRRIHLNSV